MTTAAPTVTEQVARELVELCRAGKNMDAISRFLSPSVVSVEPHDFEGFPATANGIDAVRKKNEWWYSTFEVNGSEVDGPYVNGDQFAVKYRFDTTNRKTGARRRDTEIAVYTVKDGKIVQERFLGYSPES
jgi:ketosteroid isomerase-like protein